MIALDSYGHYDPTLEADDVLVLEDGVAQQVRSVRHIPANVLLVLDTGGELSGLGGLSKSTSLTRQVATDLVKRLQDGSWIEVLQSNNSVEVLQSWTTDKLATLKTLKTKVSSGKRSRFSDALAAAAQQLKGRPEGVRHVVIITDGVDSPGGKISRADAVTKLIAARHGAHHQLQDWCGRERQENYRGIRRASGCRPRSDHADGSGIAARAARTVPALRRHQIRSGDATTAQSL